MAKFAQHEFEYSVVRNVAGGGDQQMIRRKPFAEAGLQRFTRKLPDSIGSAENRAAQWMLGPESAGENFVQQRFRIVEIHLDFFEDHLAFLVDVIGIETGAQAKIGNNIERDGEVIVENLGVETNLFFGRERIEHAADGIHFAGDGFGGAPLGALENHVLHEMREAVLFGSFAAGTVANPHADRNRADVAHGLGHDDQTVGQNVALNVARFGNHIWSGGRASDG